MPPAHHHHGGHIPQSGFPWGNWAWAQPSVQYIVLEDEGVPDWLWIAGGVLAGAVLALLARGK
jgi:hypothetical protein